MGKQVSAKSLAWEEEKKRLIAKIESLDCNDIDVFEKKKNIFINELFLFEVLGDHPISPDSKNGQVTAAEKVFNLFPEKFEIKSIGDVVNQYRKNVKYLYVYFLYEGGEVNIAFLFKNDFYMGDLFNMSDGEFLYVLNSNELILQTKDKYEDIGKAILNFEDFFKQSYSNSKFTKYIIYNMDLINRNFKSFEDNTEILIGAMPYGDNIDRPNLILKIHKDCVGIKVYERLEGDYYFFNMGHLYP